MQASNLYNVTESDNKLVDLFFFPSTDFTNIQATFTMPLKLITNSWICFSSPPVTSLTFTHNIMIILLTEKPTDTKISLNTNNHKCQHFFTTCRRFIHSAQYINITIQLKSGNLHTSMNLVFSRFMCRSAQLYV